MIKTWTGISLWKRTFIALLLGWGVGYAIPNAVIITTPIAAIFINAIKMIVLPLIVSTLISAIVNIGSFEDLKTMIGTTIGWFLTTAIIATILGLGVGTLLEVGKGAEFTLEGWKGWTVPDVGTNFSNLIASNPIKAMADGKIIPVLLFSLTLAIASVKAGKKAKPFNDFFTAFSEVMFNVVRFIMELSPIGVFAIIVGITTKYGWSGIAPLLDVVVAIYLVAILHITVTYSLLLKFIAKVNPVKFFKTILPAQLTAFSTTSSYGTLPVTLKVIQNAGVSKRVASFVAPLGSSINMDGCGAFYPAISSIFIANLYGIDLSLTQYAIIVLTATIASLGTAGVPWASATALMVVLPAVGLPIEPVALLFTIDRILDMARTTVNVTGDTVVSAIVSRKLGDFDDEKLKLNS